MVAEAVNDVRAVSRGIHPAILSEGGAVVPIRLAA
jgi:hypothetical protein